MQKTDEAPWRHDDSAHLFCAGTIEQQDALQKENEKLQRSLMEWQEAYYKLEARFEELELTHKQCSRAVAASACSNASTTASIASAACSARRQHGRNVNAAGEENDALLERALEVLKGAMRELESLRGKNERLEFIVEEQRKNEDKAHEVQQIIAEHASTIHLLEHANKALLQAQLDADASGIPHPVACPASSENHAPTSARHHNEPQKQAEALSSQAWPTIAESLAEDRARESTSPLGYPPHSVRGTLFTEKATVLQQSNVTDARSITPEHEHSGEGRNTASAASLHEHSDEGRNATLAELPHEHSGEGRIKAHAVSSHDHSGEGRNEGPAVSPHDHAGEGRNKVPAVSLHNHAGEGRSAPPAVSFYDLAGEGRNTAPAVSLHDPTGEERNTVPAVWVHDHASEERSAPPAVSSHDPSGEGSNTASAGSPQAPTILFPSSASRSANTGSAHTKSPTTHTTRAQDIPSEPVSRPQALESYTDGTSTTSPCSTPSVQALIPSRAAGSIVPFHNAVALCETPSGLLVPSRIRWMDAGNATLGTVAPQEAAPIRVSSSSSAPLWPSPTPEPLKNARTSNLSSDDSSATDSSSYTSSGRGSTHLRHPYDPPWRTTSSRGDGARCAAAASECAAVTTGNSCAHASSSPLMDKDAAHCTVPVVPVTVNTHDVYLGTARETTGASCSSLRDGPPLNESPMPPTHDTLLHDIPPVHECLPRDMPSASLSKRRGASLEDRPGG